MIGIAVIACIAFFLAFLYPVFHRRPAEVEHNARYDVQMKRLWNAAQTSMKEHKPLRAEKALLTILKFDERNAAAYNRLGILYAKEQKFDEAIECFEIAQSLDNNPSSLHNVGLIYLETGAYEKATMAFEQAIELENTVPARFIALAKARERLGQTKAAIEALESAYELDHSTNTLRLILAIHEATGDIEALANTTARIEEQIAQNSQTTERKRVTKPRAKRVASTTGAASTSTRRLAGASTSTRRVAAGSASAKRVAAAPTRKIPASTRTARSIPATTRRKKIN